MPMLRSDIISSDRPKSLQQMEYQLTPLRTIKSMQNLQVPRNAVLRILARDCSASFLGLLLDAMNQLIWVQSHGQLPAFVYFGPACVDGSRNPYFNQSRGPNVWEYHFEQLPSPAGRKTTLGLSTRQPSIIELDARTLHELHHLSADSVQPYPHGIYRHFKSPVWRFDEPWHWRMRLRARAVLARHVQFKPQTVGKAKAFYANNMLAFGDRPLLGVHIRSIYAAQDSARRLIPADEYYPLINLYLQHRPETLIFLSTDSRAILERAKDKYGNRIIGMERMKKNSETDEAGSERGRSMLGRDCDMEIIEALIMSCSNFLIKPASAMSEFAVYFNPFLHNHTIEMQYEVGQSWAELLVAAHFGHARSTLRGYERCTPYLHRNGSLEK